MSQNFGPMFHLEHDVRDRLQARVYGDSFITVPTVLLGQVWKEYLYIWHVQEIEHIVFSKKSRHHLDQALTLQVML